MARRSPSWTATRAKIRRVGKGAQRRVPTFLAPPKSGGHAALCPPYGTRAKTKMAGIAPGHFHSYASRSARWRGAGRRGRQCGLAAVEQRRDATDGDAPVDQARPVGLLL